MGKALNYSTTFINTGIFTVHSLLVAVTIEIKGWVGNWGGEAEREGGELPPKKKRIKN